MKVQPYPKTTAIYLIVPSTRMLSRIGESTVNLEFSRKLIQQISTCSTLVYDITSLSSYSQNISLLEYGYNEIVLIYHRLICTYVDMDRIR